MSGSGGRGYKKYGGRDRSSAGNIVSHSVSNGGRVIVTNSSGSNNSKTVTQSHLDMSNNSLLNVECIYFSDGTVQCTAGGTGGGGGGTPLPIGLRIIRGDGFGEELGDRVAGLGASCGFPPIGGGGGRFAGAGGGAGGGATGLAAATRGATGAFGGAGAAGAAGAVAFPPDRACTCCCCPRPNGCCCCCCRDAAAGPPP